MLRARQICVTVAMVAVVGVLTSGCPTGEAPDYPVTLLISTKSLDFGRDANSLTFNVSKVYTSRPMSPLRVTSTAPWLSFSFEPATRLSTGPDNPIVVTATLNRDLLGFGANTARIAVDAAGVVPQYVDVTATSALVAQFSVDKSLAFEDEVITFVDQSRSDSPILEWEWDFGDGATSTDQNPTHQYAAEGEYTVSLSIATADGAASRTKPAYVAVRKLRLPVADFSVSAEEVLAGTQVQFMDLSAPGTAPITQWLWTFGDGTTSNQPNPSHTYSNGGQFTVSLTVTTIYGSDTHAVGGLVSVLTEQPIADFTADKTTPLYNTQVRFTDLSDAGTAPIGTWLWTFGDGGTSYSRNPVHTYARSGRYTVTLMVVTNHGSDTVVKENYIEAQVEAPTFEIDNNNKYYTDLDALQFMDTSTTGDTWVTARTWRFGDGASSALQNPTHSYTVGAEGVREATVELELAYANGLTNSTTQDIRIYESSNLDAYLRRDEVAGLPASDGLTHLQSGPGYTAYTMNLISQVWRTYGSYEAVDSRGNEDWQHWVQIIEPDVIDTPTALLFVDGGSRNYNRPTSLDGDAKDILPVLLALRARTIWVQSIPNQRLWFADDPYFTNPLDGPVVPYAVDGRTEDEIISYSFKKFLDNYPDDSAKDWPVLFAMVKSIVAAMDAVQVEYEGDAVPVQDFIVTGASKRGWTTWLTTASDTRVRAAIPMVIDFLNMEASMAHHNYIYSNFNTGPEFNMSGDLIAFDGYSAEVHDYTDLDVFSSFSTEAGRELLKDVDPFAYRKRFQMPRLGLNGTGDQFFLPDSAQFYIDELKQESDNMWVRYIPHADHGLGLDDRWANLRDFEDTPLLNLATFFKANAADTDGAPIPKINWEVDGNRITLTVEDGVVPAFVNLVRATSPIRTFRLDTINPTTKLWTKTRLNPVNGVYTATVPTPPAGQYTAFFIEAALPSGFTAGDFPGLQLGLPSYYPLPHIFTTEVTVVPE